MHMYEDVCVLCVLKLKIFFFVFIFMLYLRGFWAPEIYHCVNVCPTRGVAGGLLAEGRVLLLWYGCAFEICSHVAAGGSSFWPVGLWFHISASRWMYIYICVLGGSEFLRAAVYIFLD